MNTGAENNETHAVESQETRQTSERLKPFRTIPMEVAVELGRGKLKLRDLLGLKYHSVFPLNEIAGSRLNVFINGVLLGKAEPVVLEDRIGIKIDEIADTEQ
jgi:flagellar motor switch protein FliN/FliY